MNKQQTRDIIATGFPQGSEKYQIKSDWLAELIISTSESGRYPYNDRIESLAIAQLGELTVDEKGRLETLVYVAQNHALELKAKRDGLIPATQEALAPFIGKKVIATQLGYGGSREVRVKLMGGLYRLMLPRARTRALPEYNWFKPLSAASPAA